MQDSLENKNVVDVRPLISPAAVKRDLPVPAEVAASVLATRAAVRDLIHGRDSKRVLAIVGPCSIHDRGVALEYAQRLKSVADEIADSVLVLMRTYFEKPRTTVGWKGLINDPALDGSCDVQRGLSLTREILLEVGAMGLGCATELLDPVTPQYVGDLLSWAAIGARTTESQTHREMASGLSMPVGFKNGVDGDLRSAKNALASARSSHSFLGITAEGATAVIVTRGNPDSHVVLRGGASGPNYAADSVRQAAAALAEPAIARPILIDCSHDNSSQDFTRQGAVCRAVIDQVRSGSNSILGFMLESNLHPGQQKWHRDCDLAYGVSITDGCIGWEETETLLREAAEAVRNPGIHSAA